MGRSAGGFKYLLIFTPIHLGKMNQPILTSANVSKGLVETTNWGQIAATELGSGLCLGFKESPI